MQPRIVSTAPIDATAIDILQAVAPVETASSPDEATLLGLTGGMIGLVCRGEAQVSGRLIAASTSLKVIGRPGAGYDSVDIQAATSRRIPVVFAPVSGFAVAEGALALLLALVKKLPECDRIVKTGQWQGRYPLKTGDMFDRTLGILGLGRIGTYFARVAQPFEMRVLGHDPYADTAEARRLGVEMVGFDELLAASDYLSLHLPLNSETRGLID